MTGAVVSVYVPEWSAAPRSAMMGQMLATLDTIGTLTRYEATIAPRARRQIRSWSERAAAIPDPALRACAQAALAADAPNAEAAAAFATMAPRALRATTAELLVAWQILYDYVDVLGERDDVDPLACGTALGAALTASLTPGGTRWSGAPDDGGYLAALVATCRERLGRLPSADAVEPAARAAAVRCAEGLSQTHAAARLDATAELRAWARRQPAADSYAWWEIAAAGNSNLAVLALLAAAADPATTERTSAAVAAAYWPHVCVLSTLLDSLVDYERDATTGNFSFLSLYADDAASERGLVRAAARSLDATAALDHPRTHATIVAGIAAFYATAADGGRAARIGPRVLAALRPTVTPILLALRAQRRFPVLR